MRHLVILPGLLFLAACADGSFGSPPPEEALMIPEDCDDSEKRLHPEWDQLCGHIWDD